MKQIKTRNVLIESKKNKSRKKFERKFFAKKKKRRTKKVHKKEKSISNIILRNLSGFETVREMFQKYVKASGSRQMNEN